MNAVHGFERPGIWLVNKHAFNDQDYEPAAAGKSNMNIGIIDIRQTIDIPDSAIEQSLTLSARRLQGCVSTVDPLTKTISTSYTLATVTISETSELQLPVSVESSVFSQGSIKTSEGVNM
ncbi:hypothetical protein HHI36_020567 [Cryptolaemus montrouzieri]|uniref:Uncharacterized protein n=1 Tax=Cryptolaemus montrouzieri TaxID=559131 RepID=A0ABD2NAQ8_9CUCU